nr:transposase zinc-binding domain-containing protein [Roseibium album]
MRVAYNSCRNRHCPKCQDSVACDWLAARAGELIPVPYFQVVFTLPAEIAAVAFQNKVAVYAILFRTAAETLSTIAAGPRQLGAEIGLITVLSSWRQAHDLSSPPPSHSAAGPSQDGTRWISCRPRFFLAVRVLSHPFRQLFFGGTEHHLRGRTAALFRRHRRPDRPSHRCLSLDRG